MVFLINFLRFSDLIDCRNLRKRKIKMAILRIHLLPLLLPRLHHHPLLLLPPPPLLPHLPPRHPLLHLTPPHLIPPLPLHLPPVLINDVSGNFNMIKHSQEKKV